MKRNYLQWIAVWEFLTAVWPLTGVAIIVHDFLDPSSGLTDGFSVAVIVVLLAYFGLAVAAGVGLLKVKRWGRILAIIHAALSLPVIPALGPIIGALILVYMFSPQTKEYFETTTE